MKRRGTYFIVTFFTITGGAIGLWAFTALVAGLHHTNWQVGELLRQYMVAVGMIGSFNTMVDFYSHIKGIEYLICLGFFVVFPLFYRYVNEDRKKIKTRG